VRDVAIRSRCWRLELDKSRRSLFVPNITCHPALALGKGRRIMQSVNAVQKSALVVQL
jgi:hypothetical protein